MQSTHVTDSTFQDEVISSTIPVIVLFWAPWCGPCKMMDPILEEVASEMGSSVKIAKVNVDENPGNPSRFGIRSIPALVLFKSGRAVATKYGVIPKYSLMEWVYI